MRASLIVAASALSLLAGSGFAQTASPSPSSMALGASVPGGSTGGGGIAAPAAAPRTPARNPLTMEDLSQVTGSSVYGLDDKKIGQVTKVLMKPDSNTVDRLVVSEGGVLGIGSHLVALPLDEFKWDADKDAFRIAKTADALKSMPEWKAASAISAGAPLSGSSVPSGTAASSSASGSSDAKSE
jgi:hypothetical protein